MDFVINTKFPSNYEQAAPSLMMGCKLDDLTVTDAEIKLLLEDAIKGLDIVDAAEKEFAAKSFFAHLVVSKSGGVGNIRVEERSDEWVFVFTSSVYVPTRKANSVKEPISTNKVVDAFIRTQQDHARAYEKMMELQSSPYMYKGRNRGKSVWSSVTIPNDRSYFDARVTPDVVYSSSDSFITTKSNMFNMGNISTCFYSEGVHSIDIKLSAVVPKSKVHNDLISAGGSKLPAWLDSNSIKVTRNGLMNVVNNARGYLSHGLTKLYMDEITSIVSSLVPSE